MPSYIGYSSPTQCARPECTSVPCGDALHPPGKPRAALYIRTTLPHALIPTEHYTSETCECVAATVRVDGVDTSVVSVYVRPVAAATYAFVSPLLAALSRDHILCGDFNADHVSWGDTSTEVRGRDLTEAIHRAGLLVLNTG